MEKEQVHVYTENDEVIIRHGDAKKLLPRKNIKISSTDIHGPARFWSAKKELYKPINCHLLYDKTKGIIVLQLNESDPEQNDEVKGKLSLNPELEKMGINSGNKLKFEEALELLRFMRMMFPNREEFTQICTSLTNFSAKVDTDFEKTKEQGGNSLQKVVVNVKHNIPLRFTLKTNIFIGQPDTTFGVDIIVNAVGSSLVFSLESIDLYELEGKIRNEIINKVLSEMPEIVSIESAL